MIAEQEREMRRRELARGEWRRGSKSVYTPARVVTRLDEPLYRNDRLENRTRQVTQADQIGNLRTASPPDELEALDLRERMAEILGDLEIEDVGRLGQHTIDHLRERLREEGLVSISVQRSERERARTSRKRGAAPDAEVG